MQLQLRQTEQFMLALGQTVRHQPVTHLPAHEAIDRLDTLGTKLAELSNALGLEQVAWPRWKFYDKHPGINQEQALQLLTESLYLLFGFYHTLGLAKYGAAAWTEVHQSNLTRLWPDDKIHRDSSGMMMKPPSYVAPDMAMVLSGYRPHSPFTPTKPSEVIEDDTV